MESDSLWTHELYSPWNSPGHNTAVSSYSLPQGIFPTQGSIPGFQHCWWILHQLSHQGSPRIVEWVASPFSSRSSRPRNHTGVSCIAGRFFTSWATREAFQEQLLLSSHCSRVRLCVTPWSVAHQIPLPIGFPRQGYWSGLPFPSPGHLPDSGIKPASPAVAGGFFYHWATWKARVFCACSQLRESLCPFKCFSLWLPSTLSGLPLVAQLVKNPPAMQETWVRSLGWEDPLGKGKATHSSILPWRIPWTI